MCDQAETQFGRQEHVAQFMELAERLNRQLHRSHLDELEGSDLTISQIRTLALVEHAGPQRMSTVAVHLGKPRVDVTYIRSGSPDQERAGRPGPVLRRRRVRTIRFPIPAVAAFVFALSALSPACGSDPAPTVYPTATFAPPPTATSDPTPTPRPTFASFAAACGRLMAAKEQTGWHAAYTAWLNRLEAETPSRELREFWTFRQRYFALLRLEAADSTPDSMVKAWESSL